VHVAPGCRRLLRGGDAQGAQGGAAAGDSGGGGAVVLGVGVLCAAPVHRQRVRRRGPDQRDCAGAPPAARGGQERQCWGAPGGGGDGGERRDRLRDGQGARARR
ncbi:hypothetical protein IWQ57_005055, partial [Coemansia nantahalensis]